MRDDQGHDRDSVRTRRRSCGADYGRRAGVIALTFIAPALFVLTSSASAGDLDQPQFAEQDAWVYHFKLEKGGNIKEEDVDVAIVRTEGDEILASFKPVSSTHAPNEHMFKSDWAAFRGINGVETITNRPLSFPLAIGKTWRVDYTEENPNAQLARERFEIPYRVIGWEQIATPAGKFKALKIEAKGSWTADVMPRSQTNSKVVENMGQRSLQTQNAVQAARRVEGRIYKVFWYVPDKKRWAKSLEEIYGPDGSLTQREETELTAFHAANSGDEAPHPEPSKPAEPTKPAETAKPQ